MIHRHLLVKARGGDVPRTAAAVERFLGDLVPAVGMEKLSEPFAVRCEDEGNVGVTGFVLIKTSHASIHAWEEAAEPFFQFDLYSCAPFEVRSVLEMVAEFSPRAVEWMLIDRDGAPEMVEAGTWRPRALAA